MTEPPLSRLEPVGDASAVTWFGERLWPWEGLPSVGQFIPEGFERYARLPHPAYHHEEGLVPWSRVAQWSGRELHSTVNFDDLASRQDGERWSSVGGSSPQEELDRSTCARIASILVEFTSSPQLCWYCLWTGYGDIRLDQPDIEVTRKLASSGRRYFLFRGPVDAVTSLEFPNAVVLAREGHVRDARGDDTIRTPAFHSPNFWWPEDRAWFVSTEIDGPSTYVGGSERLIARLLADTELEVLPATVHDPFEGVHPGMRPPD